MERQLSIQVQNESLAMVLKSISMHTGVLFSYSPNTVDASKKVSLNFYKKPLRVVLDELMRQTGCIYKKKSNYIILYPAPRPTGLIVVPREIELRGYVYDAGAKHTLSDVSIFNKKNQQALLTDQYGFFQLKVPVSELPLTVKAAKQHYKDTVFVINQKADNQVEIFLTQELVVVQTEPVPNDSTPPVVDTAAVAKADSVVPRKPWYERTFLSKEIKATLRNIKDTVFSNVQIGLIPYLSTNRLLAGNAVNKVSFNLLVGYSRGASVVEVGGIMNIDQERVRYAQVAGVANVVGGKVTGAQVSGLFNVDRDTVEGASVSGALNMARYLKGAQVAGIANLSKEGGEGVQVSGLFNRAASFEGTQVAGLFNSGRHIDGGQISGLFNQADTLDGVQVSGLFNQAKQANGVQLAVINLADTSTGVPIGIFSYVKKGYHKIELFGDELIETNVAFRTGVNKLHNIFFVGISPSHFDYTLWTMGLGFGSTLPLTGKWKLTVDLTSQQVLRNFDAFEANSLNRVFAGLEYPLSKKASICLGPVLNILTTNTDYKSASETADEMAPYNILRDKSESIDTRLWIGGKLSLKFF